MRMRMRERERMRMRMRMRERERERKRERERERERFRARARVRGKKKMMTRMAVILRSSNIQLSTEPPRAPPFSRAGAYTRLFASRQSKM